MEACASSHHWARELIALGHQVKLMPAQYVKPYVKRGKNDAADAEAICEAVTRPTMRFVAIKTPEQQSAMMQRREAVALHYSRGEFGTWEDLAGALGRERAKDVTLDYVDGFAARRTIGASAPEQGRPEADRERVERVRSLERDRGMER
jgi:hypothetical protein